jgi:hypothetical protein
MERYLITNQGRDVEPTQNLFDYLVRKFIPKWIRDLLRFLREEVSIFEIFKNIYFKILKTISDLLMRLSVPL